MNKILYFALLLQTNLAFCENPCNTMYPQKSGEWGIGSVWIAANLEVPVYEKPNGQKIGILARDKFGRVTVKKVNENSLLKINSNDLVWVGHTWYTLLKVYSIKS